MAEVVQMPPCWLACKIQSTPTTQEEVPEVRGLMAEAGPTKMMMTMHRETKEVMEELLGSLARTTNREPVQLTQRFCSRKIPPGARPGGTRCG